MKINKIEKVVIKRIEENYFFKISTKNNPDFELTGTHFRYDSKLRSIIIQYKTDLPRIFNIAPNNIIIK